MMNFRGNDINKYIIQKSVGILVYIILGYVKVKKKSKFNQMLIQD